MVANRLKQAATALAVAGAIATAAVLSDRVERAELLSSPLPPSTPLPGGALGACVVHVGTAVVCGAPVSATVTISWGGVSYSAVAGIGRAAALPAPPGWLTQPVTVELPGRTVVVPPVRIVRPPNATALSVTAPSTVTIWHLSWDAAAGAHRGYRYDVPPGMWAPPRGLHPRDELYAEVSLGNSFADGARYPVVWRQLWLPIIRRGS